MNQKKWFWKTVLFVFLVTPLMMHFGSIQAEADVKQIKFYKEAFPGSKPKCLFCHTDEVPKKAEGKHDLNAYGLKVQETAEEITADTYTEVGTIEDFEHINAQDDEVIEEEKMEQSQEDAASVKSEPEEENEAEQ
jgi:hypothetical protein